MIEPGGERVIAFVSVRDSNNLAQEPIEAGSTGQDLGNNTNWTFSTGTYLWSGRSPSNNFNDSGDWFGDLVPGRRKPRSSRLPG